MRKRHIGRVMAAGLAAVVAYVLGGRSRHRRWGTTGDELYAPMPGDELVPCPAMSATHAITVDVPADRVWPWLTQLGQEMKVGDLARLGPQPYPVWVVWSLEPRRSLLFRTADPHTGRAVEEADVARGRWAGTWSFVLRPLNAWSTRLVVRLRIDWRRTPANALRGWGLTEPAHFVTGRRMLKTIKARAERDRDCLHNGVSFQTVETVSFRGRRSGRRAAADRRARSADR